MPRGEKNLPFLTKASSNSYRATGSPRPTLKKEERLTSKKLIDQLFAEGQTVLVPPFKFLWITSELEANYPMQIAFSAPKKHFPKAVDRNRIKRLCREAYRHNKHIAYDYLDLNHTQCAAMLIYTEREMPILKELKSKIITTLERFIDACETFK